MPQIQPRFIGEVASKHESCIEKMLCWDVDSQGVGTGAEAKGIPGAGWPATGCLLKSTIATCTFEGS